MTGKETRDKESALSLSDLDGEHVRVLDLEDHACNLDLIVLRDKDLQSDRARFRDALYHIGYDMGRVIASEMIRSRPQKVMIKTPLGMAEQKEYQKDPILLCIVRAALPMWQGMQDAFPNAKSGFVAASRVEGTYAKENQSIDVSIDYGGVPSLQNETLIIVDPMLATACSVTGIYKQLIQTHGKPRHTHLASVIAAPEGVQRVLRDMPGTRIITASLDDHLDERGYIVPGLGDAGDLCFGKKKDTQKTRKE